MVDEAEGGEETSRPRYTSSPGQLRIVENLMREHSRGQEGYIIWLNSEKAEAKGYLPLSQLKPSYCHSLESIAELKAAAAGIAALNADDNTDDDEDEDSPPSAGAAASSRRVDLSLKTSVLEVVNAARSVAQNLSTSRFSVGGKN
jgi:hypothetical protein